MRLTYFCIDVSGPHTLHIFLINFLEVKGGNVNANILTFVLVMMMFLKG